jgi:hypothetical protein
VLSKSLVSKGLELDFDMKILELTNFMNEELRRDKKDKAFQEKLIEHLMMQSPRLSSSTKKLAKVNMQSTSSRLEKAMKEKDFFLEMDKYYDVQN